MAPRLLRAGYHLTIYDRTPEKAQAVGQLGEFIAQTPRDLATTCDVLISCVTNDSALEDIMFGPDEALAGVHDSSVIIEMSTVAPQTSRHLFQAAKEKDVPMIDAAVSGSVPQVEEGSLVIFVGGDQETIMDLRFNDIATIVYQENEGIVMIADHDGKSLPLWSLSPDCCCDSRGRGGGECARLSTCGPAR